MQPVSSANLRDRILAGAKTKTCPSQEPGQTRIGHCFLVCANTTLNTACGQDHVSSPASSMPFRSRETGQPVDSKQLVGRSQHLTSSRVRLQFPKIFPRGHWLCSKHSTPELCKSHEAKQPIPHCRQRHPHQIVWHPPHRTSTGASKVYVAFHCRRRYSMHSRRRLPPFAQPPGRSRQQKTHPHRQLENYQGFSVSTPVVPHLCSRISGQVSVSPS